MIKHCSCTSWIPRLQRFSLVMMVLIVLVGLIKQYTYLIQGPGFSAFLHLPSQQKAVNGSNLFWLDLFVCATRGAQACLLVLRCSRVLVEASCLTCVRLFEEQTVITNHGGPPFLSVTCEQIQNKLFLEQISKPTSSPFFKYKITVHEFHHTRDPSDRLTQLQEKIGTLRHFFYFENIHRCCHCGHKPAHKFYCID